MGNLYMGNKKNYKKDIFIYFIVAFITLFSLFISTNFIFEIVLLFINFAFDKNFVVYSILNSYALEFIFFIIFTLIRKTFYYETLKWCMPTNYNINATDKAVELWIPHYKNKNVIINWKDVKKIETEVIKNKAKYIKIKDTNFSKDICIIKLYLEDYYNVNNIKRKGFYYNVFVRKKDKKTKNNVLYLYEIIYDDKSDENVKKLVGLCQINIDKKCIEIDN